MKRNIVICMISFLALLVAACGTANETEKRTSSNSDAAEETIIIKHELDDTEVTKNPKKVIVFDYGILDTLDLLEIEVTGVAKGNIPSYLEKYENDAYENIGSLKEPDFDKISAIDPDLIIISGRQAPVYDELTKLAPTIHLGVDNARYMDSFVENMEVIGKIFDKEVEVDEELTKIEESITSLNEKARSVDAQALIILANDDKISAYGPSSRFGIIHDVFGVAAVDKGIEVSTHGMNVSFEYVMEQNPDLLYVVDRGAAIGEESSAKKIVENKLVENTNAYKNNKITYLDPDFWYLSGGGLVSVAEMINEITNSIE